jgi:hypothetical protein
MSEARLDKLDAKLRPDVSSADRTEKERERLQYLCVLRARGGWMALADFADLCAFADEPVRHRKSARRADHEKFERAIQDGQPLAPLFYQERLEQFARIRGGGRGAELDRVLGVLSEAFKPLAGLSIGQLEDILAVPLPQEPPVPAPEPPKPQPEPEPAPVKPQGSLISQVLEETTQQRSGRAPTYDHNDEIYGWDLE